MERKILEQIQKKPNILTKQFVDGVHPYTMMFLYQSYDQGAYHFLDELHIKIFDRYYVGNLTIENQKNDKFRGHIELIIREGFESLRQHTSEELNSVFTEKKLPYFKDFDTHFVSNSEYETKLMIAAKKSITHKGKELSEDHKRKIGQGNIGRKHSPESRKKMSQAKIGKKQTPEHIAKRTEKMKEIFANPEYIERLSEINKAMWRTKEHREKMRKIRTGRRLSEEHKQKIGLGNKGKIRSPEVREKLSEIAKIREAKKKEQKK